ncbi:MAG: hypothetical protein ACRDTS_22245, partial [Mycobacterium sp.]
MARSPIGRRHPRPGSVPVIEYLAREPQAVPRVDQRWVPVLGEDGTIPPMPTGAERTDAPPATTGGNTTAITTAEVYREPHGERSAVAAEPPPASLPGDGDGTGHGGATHRGLTGPAEQAQVAGRGRVGRLAGIAAGV